MSSRKREALSGAQGLSVLRLQPLHSRRWVVARGPGRYPGVMTTEPVEDWRALYDEAFDRFQLRALWSYTRGARPTPEVALAISRALRRQGDLEAWRLAVRLERACRAA